MNNTKRILAGLLALFMIISFAGCKKAPEEDSEYSVIYITRPGQNTSDTASENKDGDNQNTTSNNQSSTQNSSANSSSPTIDMGGGKDKVVYKDNTSRLKDLKGRKIIFVQTWDPTDRTSSAGKIIAKTERMLNCTLEERKMTSYTALYASILAGNPIADMFCPKDKGVLNLAANNMVVPLDTLSNFNLTLDCWDQQALKDSSYNGHIYGIVRNKQWREILFYNKDMFKKNNWEDLYTLQKQGKLTWDKLYEIMNKAATVNSAGSVTRYGLVPLYSLEEFGKTLLMANGVPGVTRVGDTKNFKNNFTSNTATLNAINTLTKWTSQNGILYDSTGAGWDSGRQVFYSGKAAMALIDYNQLSQIENNADFEWGCVLFPHGPDSSQDLLMHNTTVTCISAGTKNPNDVALFWDVLRDNMNETFGGDLVDNGDYDATYYATLNRYFDELQAGKGTYDYCGSFGVTAQLKDIIDGKTTAAAAIASVQQTLDAKMKAFWE